MAKLQRVLATFGTAGEGRLGHGFPLTSQFFPRIVSSLVDCNIVQVACGGAHTAALSDDGTLYTFGLNEDGQLGHSKEDKFMPIPLEVGLPDPVKAIAAGDRHTLALTRSGEVWAFGRAGEGQLGIGTPPGDSRQVEPRLVKGLQGVRVSAVAAGSTHSLALTEAGELFSWGHNDAGALGHGAMARGGPSAPTEMSPRLVRALAGRRLQAICCGPFCSGAIDASGRAITWGHGINWQLGHGEGRHEPMPRDVLSLPRVSALSLGQLHSLAVLADGAVVAWGTDDSGSLGQGQATARQRFLPLPKHVPGLPACHAVSAGWRHSLAVSETGKAFTWGSSGAAGHLGWVDHGGGQLGHGGVNDAWSPEQIRRLHTNEHRSYDLRMSFVRPWRVLRGSCGRGHTAAVIEVELDRRDLAE